MSSSTTHAYSLGASDTDSDSGSDSQSETGGTGSTPGVFGTSKSMVTATTGDTDRLVRAYRRMSAADIPSGLGAGLGAQRLNTRRISIAEAFVGIDEHKRRDQDLRKLHEMVAKHELLVAKQARDLEGCVGTSELTAKLLTLATTEEMDKLGEDLGLQVGQLEGGAGGAQGKLSAPWEDALKKKADLDDFQMLRDRVDALKERVKLSGVAGGVGGGTDGRDGRVACG